MRSDERWLMQLAVVAWQTTFADKAKHRTVWKVVRAADGKRGDLFCLFCGDFMHAVTRRKRDWHGADFSALVESHTTICGLMWLAGMSDAVARYLVRLPLEFRAAIPTSDAADRMAP